jgi:hypothetical protein
LLGGLRALVLRSANGFTKNIASCDFFLAGIRPLVLRSAFCRDTSR